MFSKLVITVCILFALPFLLIVIALIQNDLPWTAPPGFSARLSRYLGSNDVSTSVNAESPELITRRYVLTREVLIKNIESVIHKYGWEIEQDLEKNETLHAVVTTRLFRFKDDVYVKLEQDAAPGYLVQVRSVSRVGKGDLGTNTRHIMNFYASLEEMLNQAKQ